MWPTVRVTEKPAGIASLRERRDEREHLSGSRSGARVGESGLLVEPPGLGRQVACDLGHLRGDSPESSRGLLGVMCPISR